MIARTDDKRRKKPRKMIADAGYFSVGNVCASMKLEIAPYITTGRRR